MELKMLDHKEMDQDGMHYKSSTYAIEGYTVYVDETALSSGRAHHLVTTMRNSQTGDNQYLPPIYHKESVVGEKKRWFEVQTVSHGALEIEEFEKFLAAQKKALEVAKVLTKELFGEDAGT